MLALHDTAAGVRLPVVPEEGRPLRLYVCGLTVYGPAHIGHGRMSLVYDILRRYLEWSGTEVCHVSNVTDIDDKIIARANKEGRSWQEVAAEYEEQWWQVTDRMGLARPHEIPHATGYIPDMIELIAELVARAAAYEIEDGVYLSVESVPGYGLLAQQPLESLRAGARVETVKGKRSPLDFVLWKKAKPGEPSWDSPFGAGRPGWHTECVVMSLALLGDGFELHGGGADLRFPHHENERAQAVALGRSFTKHWMHNGMVESGGEKMARSVGNVTGLAEVLEQFDPRAYRLLVLQAHYRAPMEVSAAQLQAASQALERLDSLARRLDDIEGPTDASSGGALTTAFLQRMDDDLDTPRATALVFEAVRAANALLARGDAVGAAREGRQALSCAAGLGLLTASSRGPSERALELARRRDLARSDRDFALADSLRDEIIALGFRVEDTPGGTRVYR